MSFRPNLPSKLVSKIKGEWKTKPSERIVTDVTEYSGPVAPNVNHLIHAAENATKVTPYALYQKLLEMQKWESRSENDFESFLDSYAYFNTLVESVELQRVTDHRYQNVYFKIRGSNIPEGIVHITNLFPELVKTIISSNTEDSLPLNHSQILMSESKIELLFQMERGEMIYCCGTYMSELVFRLRYLSDGFVRNSNYVEEEFV